MWAAAKYLRTPTAHGQACFCFQASQPAPLMRQPKHERQLAKTNPVIFWGALDHHPNEDTPLSPSIFFPNEASILPFEPVKNRGPQIFLR